MVGQIPEMVGQLLTFLDLQSTLCLAQCHEMTRKILQDTVVWNRLIRRSSPLDQQEKVEDLVAILKLMKDPKDNLPGVLHAICETNTSTRTGFLRMEFVEMGCPLQPLHSHSISLMGFELLEKVEKAFETTVQSVESIALGPMGRKDVRIKSPLASRMSRQQQKLTSLSIKSVSIRGKMEAEEFKTWMIAMRSKIMQLRLRLVIVGHPIGPFGFESYSGTLSGTGEAAWTRLCQILDRNAS